jgi:hypothetical protein
MSAGSAAARRTASLDLAQSVRREDVVLDAVGVEANQMSSVVHGIVLPEGLDTIGGIRYETRGEKSAARFPPSGPEPRSALQVYLRTRQAPARGSALASSSVDAAARRTLLVPTNADRTWGRGRLAAPDSGI